MYMSKNGALFMYTSKNGAHGFESMWSKKINTWNLIIIVRLCYMHLACNDIDTKT
jgi:hypothetical protein